MDLAEGANKRFDTSNYKVKRPPLIRKTKKKRLS